MASKKSERPNNRPPTVAVIVLGTRVDRNDWKVRTVVGLLERVPLFTTCSVVDVELGGSRD